MSNVEYRCPHTGPDGNRDCGFRHFAPAGGTKQRCRHHDTTMVQTEEGHGPDFLYVDEKGRTKSKDSIVGQDKLRASAEDRQDGEAHIVPATGEQVILRGVYKDLTGDDPDLRWGPTRLRQEMDDWKAQFTSEHSDSITHEPEVAGERNLPSDVNETDWDTDGEPGEPVTIPSNTGTIVEEIPD